MSLALAHDEFEIWTHSGLCLYRFSIFKCLICTNNLCYIVDFQEYGLRNKATILIGKRNETS